MPPTPLATARQMRELDRIAAERYGIPPVVLMENAGRACAEAAVEMLGNVEGKRVAVVCGRGNNGGDGFVIARHLANRGADVEVVLLAGAADVRARGGEAATNLDIALRMGIPVAEAATPDEAAAAVRARAGSDLIVDAMLGTGASGRVCEPFLSAILEMNAAEAPVLAVDVPSGLDCDTGEPLGAAVRADRTVTFALNKVGFARPGATAYTGRVTVADIGLPRAALAGLPAGGAEGAQ